MLQHNSVLNSSSKGRGGGQVISKLTFNSDNLSSNLESSSSLQLQFRQSEFEFSSSLQCFCKIVVEKNENKQKEAGVGPFFLKRVDRSGFR